ncbi:ATPase [Burkholderiales bacterium 8X]|nr:ATPase [Burkholderiales bacterium 8X]
MKNWFRKPTVAANDEAAVVAAGGAERALRRLEWTVIRRLDGLLQGDYRTLMRGTGLDLADLREYQHHDDVRHIDWNVTARLQTPHVRVFTEDREMAAWFVLDLSRSVDFGSGTKAKREISAGFVGVIARLLTRHGNRVGALVYGNDIEAVIPPRSGRRHVLHLLHAMERRAETKAAPDQKGMTRLADLLKSAAALMPRRSTVFVVSDFLSEPGWERPLAQLTQRHEVVAVRLFDPLERELPDLGLVPLRDAETGEQVWVDTHDAGFRKRFARIAAERETVLRDTFAKVGVDALELSTNDDLVASIVRFADMRKRRIRAGSLNFKTAAA